MIATLLTYYFKRDYKNFLRESLNAMNIKEADLAKWNCIFKEINIGIIPSLSFLAKASIWIVGSDPIDKKQMRGVLLSLSSQVFSKFKMTGSVYFSSNESAIYFLACESVRSGHQHLGTNICHEILTEYNLTFFQNYFMYLQIIL